MEIRFHLDEGVRNAIAKGLRARRIDVTTAADAGLMGASDEEHLAYALGEGRVVMTHDEDFLVCHSQGADHAGICYCHQGARSIGELLKSLILIHDALTAEEMRGRVEFL